MYLSKSVALVSLFLGVIYAEIVFNCSSVATVFVTVTSTQETKTVSVPFEASPSITSKNGELAKLQVAEDTWTNTTAASTDCITLIHVIPTVPKIAASAVTEKGPYYFSTKNDTTVWLEGRSPPAGVPMSTSTAIVTIQPLPPSSRVMSGGSPISKPIIYSTVFLTIISKVTETLTKTAPADRNSSDLTTPVQSSNTAPLAFAAPLIAFVPSAATASLSATKYPKPFTGLGSNGWNATLKTLINEKLVGSANEPAKLLRVSQPTGVKDNLITRPGTAFLLAVSTCSNSTTNDIVSSAATASQIAITSAKPFARIGSDGWNATLRTLINEKLVASAKEPAKLLSQQTGVKENFVTRSGTASLLAVPSWSTNATNSFQNKLLLSLPSAQQLAPTASIASAVPVLSGYPAPSFKASTLGFSNKSGASKSAWRAAYSCTGKAKFTINFDDLPHSSTTGEAVPTPSIANPYHNLFFEHHYRYVHQPNGSFPPVSPPRLAVYQANQGINVDGSPDTSLESIGEFGAGPRALDSAYWIDAFSLWIGCENVGPSDCVITINGYKSGHSIRAVSKTVTQPSCPGLVGCKLALVEFPDNFRDLVGIQILAAVNRKLTAFYIDDVSLGWSNNTCAAQTKRSSAR